MGGLQDRSDRNRRNERQPAPWESLPEILERGLSFLRSLENPVERATVFSLWSARTQFYWDGNKRTERIMLAGN